MNKLKSSISFVAAAVTVCVGFGVLANTGLRDETAGVRDYTAYAAENNLVDINNELAPRPQANMTYTDGALTISNLVGDAKLIHASYKDGALSNVEITDAANGTTNVETRSGDKFMLWSAVDAIMPLCEAVTVETGTYNEDNKSKILIAYFSRTGENYAVGYINVGNTARIANYINEKVDADTFEILAKEPYSDVYSEATARAQREQNEDARPEFLGEINNFDQYDIVFIGYPIWYETMPMIMFTFLEQYDMSGKTVIPFSTNEGSGWGSSLSDLNSLCPNSDILTGFSTRGQNAQSVQPNVNSWLEGLGY